MCVRGAAAAATRLARTSLPSSPWASASTAATVRMPLSACAARSLHPQPAARWPAVSGGARKQASATVGMPSNRAIRRSPFGCQALAVAAPAHSGGGAGQRGVGAGQAGLPPNAQYCGWQPTLPCSLLQTPGSSSGAAEAGRSLGGLPETSILPWGIELHKGRLGHHPLEVTRM